MEGNLSSADSSDATDAGVRLPRPGEDGGMSLGEVRLATTLPVVEIGGVLSDCIAAPIVCAAPGLPLPKLIPANPSNASLLPKLNAPGPVLVGTRVLVGGMRFVELLAAEVAEDAAAVLVVVVGGLYI